MEMNDPHYGSKHTVRVPACARDERLSEKRRKKRAEIHREILKNSMSNAVSRRLHASFRVRSLKLKPINPLLLK